MKRINTRFFYISHRIKSIEASQNFLEERNIPRESVNPSISAQQLISRDDGISYRCHVCPGCYRSIK
jgi:hypothetical protein